MSVIGLLLVAAIFCALFWAFNKYVPISSPWKGIILFIAIALFCWWMLGALGVVGGPMG